MFAWAATLGLRAAELEIAAGERAKPGDVALPKDVPERVRGWADGEGTQIGEREELVGEISAAMSAKGRDPTPMREGWAARLGTTLASLGFRGSPMLTF